MAWILSSLSCPESHTICTGLRPACCFLRTKHSLWTVARTAHMLGHQKRLDEHLLFEEQHWYIICTEVGSFCDIQENQPDLYRASFLRGTKPCFAVEQLMSSAPRHGLSRLDSRRANGVIGRDVGRFWRRATDVIVGRFAGRTCENGKDQLDRSCEIRKKKRFTEYRREGMSYIQQKEG